jgi:hypothetical protein
MYYSTSWSWCLLVILKAVGPWALAATSLLGAAVWLASAQTPDSALK